MGAGEIRQTRLSAFARHVAVLRPHDPGRAVQAMLTERPELPGVVIVDDDDLVVGVVSRKRFLDVMGKPFGRSLFADRPVARLMATIDAQALMLPSSMPLAVAAQRALARENGAVEPVVVVEPDGSVGLVDVVELLRAQNAELVDAVEQTVEQRDAARDANRAKGDFLANMSHEIRTPLTAILGFSDLLLDGAEDPELTRESLDAIRRNGRHLLSLINDVLDFSKLQARRIEIESIDVDVVELVAEAVEMVRPQADEKGIDLVVEHVFPIVRRVRTDPLRLRQILVNLLGNAVKFTAKGEVAVRVALSCPWTDGELVIEVEDTGIGMTPEQLEQVFEMFVQADASTTRLSGGTGLGLAISRDLARLLGGDIVASSRSGHGSLFRVNVSAGAVDESDLIADEEGLLASAPERSSAYGHRQVEHLEGRVLVVEDNPVNQRLVRLMLARLGLESECASNGREALEHLAVQGPAFDAVLMDVRMPEMDGMEATASLRASGCDLPIIALTAQTLAGDREACLAAGYTDFVAKPIARDDLEHALRRALLQTAG